VICEVAQECVEEVLTDKYAGHEGRWQTEHDDEDVRYGEVDDEIVGNCAHSGGAVNHGDNEAVAHQAHREHD